MIYKETTAFFFSQSGFENKKEFLQFLEFYDNIRELDIFLLHDGSAVFSNDTYSWHYPLNSFSVSYKNERNSKSYLLYPYEIAGIIQTSDTDYKMIQELISVYKFSKPKMTGGKKKKSINKELS